MKPGAEGTPRTDAAERACESIDALYGAQPLSRLCRALEREAAALRHDLLIHSEAAKQLGRLVREKDDERTAFRDEAAALRADRDALEMFLIETKIDCEQLARDESLTNGERRTWKSIVHRVNSILAKHGAQHE